MLCMVSFFMVLGVLPDVFAREVCVLMIKAADYAESVVFFLCVQKADSVVRKGLAIFARLSR